MGVLAAILLAAGCSSGDSGTDAAPPDRPATAANAGGLGEGRLVLASVELPFEVDVCFEGAGTDLSPALRVDVEGTGTDSNGRRFGIDIVRTAASNGELIDVVRVRHDDRPAGASYEAQRVNDPATGEVHDLWGDGRTPLLVVSRTGDEIDVRMDDAVFGDYPGGGGDPGIAGTGDMAVTCTAMS